MILPGRRPVGTRRGHGAAAEECGARRAAEEDGGRRRPLRLPEPVAPRGGRLAREIVDARVVNQHGHSSKLGARLPQLQPRASGLKELRLDHAHARRARTPDAAAARRGGESRLVVARRR